MKYRLPLVKKRQISKLKANKEIQKIWSSEGWTYEETNLGFKVWISFPFMQFDRIITIYFEQNDKGKKYYHIETQIYSKDRTSTCMETLCVEMKEHLMIQKTLELLGWIKGNEEIKKKKIKLFRRGKNNE